MTTIIERPSTPFPHTHSLTHSSQGSTYHRLSLPTSTYHYSTPLHFAQKRTTAPTPPSLLARTSSSSGSGSSSNMVGSPNGGYFHLVRSVSNTETTTTTTTTAKRSPRPSPTNVEATATSSTIVNTATATAGAAFVMQRTPSLVEPSPLPVLHDDDEMEMEAGENESGPEAEEAPSSPSLPQTPSTVFDTPMAMGVPSPLILPEARYPAQTSGSPSTQIMTIDEIEVLEVLEEQSVVKPKRKASKGFEMPPPSYNWSHKEFDDTTAFSFHHDHNHGSNDYETFHIDIEQSASSSTFIQPISATSFEEIPVITPGTESELWSSFAASSSRASSSSSSTSSSSSSESESYRPSSYSQASRRHHHKRPPLRRKDTPRPDATLVEFSPLHPARTLCRGRPSTSGLGFKRPLFKRRDTPPPSSHLGFRMSTPLEEETDTRKRTLKSVVDGGHWIVVDERY